MITLKSKVSTILLIILIGCISFTYSTTPTERYLKKQPIEKIKKAFEANFNGKEALLMEIIDQETENTFFGYHGMSQKTRLFQDILRTVFEESLHIPLPKDFYFLRIPGEVAWNWNHGKKSFLEVLNRPVPVHYQELIITNWLLTIEKSQRISLAKEDFTPKEFSNMCQYFQDHIDYSVKNDWINHADKYALPHKYTYEKLEFNQKLPILLNVIDSKIKERYPEADHQKILDWINSDFSDSYNVTRLFYLRELDVQDDALLGDIDRFFVPFDDTSPFQQAALVSMNISLFGNYHNSGCSTVKIFIENEAVLDGDMDLQIRLQTFFAQIGLDPNLVNAMWEKGEAILTQAGVNHGCLLQFYDESAVNGQKPLAFVNKNAFISFKHAVPVLDLLPSKIIQGNYKLKNKSKDLELRLIMNNQTTLNPFSLIRIKRHDELSKHVSRQILLEMKELLKESVKDEEKMSQYIHLLESMWNVPLNQ